MRRLAPALGLRFALMGAGPHTWAKRGTLTVVVAVALALGAAAPAAASGLEPGGKRYPGAVVEKNVPIKMSDGVTLEANVTRPADSSGSAAPGRFPVIITQTPYNKDVLSEAGGGVATLAGPPPNLVHHGYVTVVVDVRGTGNSAGQWQSFDPREQKDGLEIANWARRQSFSNGKLGLFGASYMAINQFFTAAQHPKGLKAMFPIIPGGDVYRDVFVHGGEFDAGFMPLWAGLVTGLGLPLGLLPTTPEAALGVIASHGPTFQTNAILNILSGGELAYDGPFFRKRSPDTVVRKVHVPTFVVGGWWDLFQRSEPRLYNALRMKPGRKQLLMGPWYHVTAGSGLGEKGTPPTLAKLALAWFDRWIKRRRDGIENFGPVTLNELGRDKWATQRRYPGRLTYRRLYLGEGSSLRRKPPAAPSEDTVVADPGAGQCNRATAQWTAGLVTPPGSCVDDERSYESTGLTYTTGPLKHSRHIVGPLSLTLRTSTTAHDTLWDATLTDVSPDGASNPITAGWLMPSRRAIDRRRSTRAPNGDLIGPYHPFTKRSLLPVTPGKPMTLRIEIFNTDAVFKKGHRIRVALTNADVPHLLPTLPDQANMAGAVNTVHVDPSHPSFLSFGQTQRRR